MNLLRNAFFALASLAFFSTITPALADTAADAGNFVQGLAQQTLTIISDTSLNKDQKEATLEKLFAGNVDIPWVGRFVLGQYWPQATDNQKQRYLAAYQAFVIRHYTERFTEYTSGSFKVTGSHADEDNSVIVNMTIQGGDSGSEPVNVDYRVHGTTGNFKIFDVVVEGVSMITTQRSEFGAAIANHDLDYLITQLSTRSTTGAGK